MNKRDGERSDAAIFGYEGDESKKQDTDWDLQNTKPHSQVFVIQLIPTKKWTNWHSKKYALQSLQFMWPRWRETGRNRSLEVINQNFLPKEVIKTIQSYDEHGGIVENNERAKERIEPIVVPYVKGVSENLRKDLAKEDVNLLLPNLSEGFQKLL